MIIQPALKDGRHLAVMMYEHTALAHQFSRAFGNDAFEAADPGDLVSYITLHHDAGWAAFDADPVTDEATGLPYNLVQTPAKYITVTSRLSPDFNERQHPFCGLLSSMHSWGLYNARYGLSNMVLIDTLQSSDRLLAEKMLDGEIERQERLKQAVTQDGRVSSRLEKEKLFQNYKQLQFFDTLALYFNRTPRSERGVMRFEHVPMDSKRDVTIEIRPIGDDQYSLSPYPFGATPAGFGFAGRFISSWEHKDKGGWAAVLRHAPTVWESFAIQAA